MDVNRLLKTIIETNSRIAKVNQHISEFVIQRESRVSSSNRLRANPLHVIRANQGAAQAANRTRANNRA